LLTDLLPVNASEREAPEHARFLFVEAVLGRGDAPEAHVLPAPDGQFVEERDGMARFDSGEEGSVAGREVLVAASSLTRIQNRLAVFVRRVRVTGVNASEVCEEGDEAPAALVDAVADGVRAADFGPRQNLVGERRRERRR
jgi:hypothetical protein